MSHVRLSPQVIREDIFPNGWVNISESLHFFTDGRVLFESEASGAGGYRHLFLYHPSREGGALQVTSGAWQVDKKGLWVDETENRVYFSATADAWTEQHLYVAPLPIVQEMARFRPCTAPVRVTAPGLTHSAMAVSPDFTMLVTCHSSLDEPPALTVRCLPDASVSANVALQGLLPAPTMFAGRPLVKPVLEAVPNSAGVPLQTAFYPPAGAETAAPGTVPLVVLVYGGTNLQQVTNDHRLVCQPRLQLLCHHGYACCIVDNQGSSRRGNAFEAAVKHRFGQLEVQDQVEAVEELCQRYPYLDLKRVAVYGWSYGGYVALMCMGARPDFFKVALAGAPVVDWRLYNAAYTERYLGTPKLNPEGYTRGSVTEHVHNFPSEQDRVFLFQGTSDENVHFSHMQALIQSLVANLKPYRLQLYPFERHGLKGSEVSLHHEQVCADTTTDPPPPRTQRASTHPHTTRTGMV